MLIILLSTLFTALTSLRLLSLNTQAMLGQYPMVEAFHLASPAISSIHQAADAIVLPLWPL